MSVHEVSDMHTRLLVQVSAVDSYCPEPHVATSVHVRSDVAVGTTVWYWEPEHVVKMAHTRSEVLVGVAVGACDSYCIDVQVVSAVHSRCEVDVRLVVSY